MEVTHILSAATGWLELGLPEDSLNELEQLPSRYRTCRKVLEIKLAAEMQAQRWNAGADTARLLCLQAPQESQFFLDASYCLHETGDTLAAKNWLMTGPAELINEPLFHYNIACYHCVLEEHERAFSHLERAFELDSSLRHYAAMDSDLTELKNFPNN